MWSRAIWALILAGILSISAAAQTSAPSKPAGNIARGKYLANNIGMCGDCHTPIDKTGNPVKTKSLQGAPLMFKPTVQIPTWMPVAPAIAGLRNGWTDEQAIAFFTTGKRPDGTMAGPPMPQFRFNKADAVALTAYLKSLR